MVISPRNRAALVRIAQVLVKRLLIGFIEFLSGRMLVTGPRGTLTTPQQCGRAIDECVAFT